MILSLLSVGLVPPSCAQDWPGILGRNRDGLAPQPQPQLNPGEWPAEFTAAWSMDLGSGFAGPAIADGTVYVAHRKGSIETLGAVNAQTGENLWISAWPASYRGSFNPDSGPRAVPAVASNYVVCYGAAGDLVCFDRRTGDQQWHRTLRKDYDADDGYFGAGSAPLIVDDLVVVCVGGKRGGIVAVELATGKTRWTSTNYDASYASPIAIARGSGRLLLVVTRLKTVLLTASDGSLLSEVAFGSRGPTVNAATPIAVGTNDYLLTASYGVGTLLVGIEGAELIERFREKNLLSSQYNTPVRVLNRVFGIHGREDIGIASLRALDVSNRKIIWERLDFGTAHLIGLERSVLALGLDGSLYLLDAVANSYEPLAASQLPAGTYRALPALVGNKLFVRATHSESSSELMMIELP